LPLTLGLAGENRGKDQKEHHKPVHLSICNDETPFENCDVLDHV
jgi:hypothetical protein